MNSSTFIALLRGINVGGRNKVSMAELCSLATDLGWVDVESYIQSGNLVFHAAGRPAELAGALESAMEEHYGLSVPVIIREAREWSGYLAANPFPEASQREPGLVMLALSKDPPTEGSPEELGSRATAGESVRQVGDALWIHYAGGAGRSKLSPGLLDRVVGSAVTTRNWRTVTRLAMMARVAPSRTENQEGSMSKGKAPRKSTCDPTRSTARKASGKSPPGGSTAEKKAKGFAEEERAAMQERARELKAEARRGTRASKSDGESDVLAKIAEMQGPDRAMAERLHAIIKSSAPILSPKTWYGMPAYARDGKVVCFFQSASKFKTRYATLGFSDAADLDEGAMWPVGFALKELTEAEEAKIRALVKKAVG
jgi:uncharacterized protein (DUF1697 family)/uncharacterized protein YdhG (YjbR/CyaY superfamily)